MGIKNFSTLLKERSSSAFIKININELSGKRIAIDLNNIMYRYFSTHLKEEIYQTDLIHNDVDRVKVVNKWVMALVDFGLLWLEHGITPVFVLDGNTRKEKEETKLKRMNEKKKARDAGKEIMDQIRNAKSLFDVNPNLLSELRKNLSKDVSLKTDEVSLLRNTLKDFRFPVLDAKFDSEQLCCSLAIEGLVEAVFSTDMDCLVFGTPLLITEFDRENREQLTLNAISLEKALNELDLGFRSFVDLCIMCGCDFNQNMPKIGPKRSYELIKEFHSIDSLPAQFDIQILDHQKCRSIFSYESSGVKIEEVNMKNESLQFSNDHQKTLERKWREGRLRLMIKNLPPPSTKPYFQMPESIENRFQVVIV